MYYHFVTYGRRSRRNDDCIKFVARRKMEIIPFRLDDLQMHGDNNDKPLFVSLICCSKKNKALAEVFRRTCGSGDIVVLSSKACHLFMLCNKNITIFLLDLLVVEESLSKKYSFRLFGGNKFIY